MSNISLAEMITTVRKAHDAILATGNHEHLLDDLDKVLDCMESYDKPQERANVLQIVGYNAEGRNTVAASTTSFDASGDYNIMSFFLELHRAFKDRNVEIKPVKVGSLWVTSNMIDNEGPVIKDTNAAMHAAVKYAINLAEANGKVLRVYSKSVPFEHRMGAHYMTYELRDCLALARKYAAQPCQVVRASNYDEEMFCETFIEDGKVMTRDEAQQLAKRLNDDPKRDDRYFYKVVDQGYTLYKFEP